jgi:hypothetical protein
MRTRYIDRNLMSEVYSRNYSVVILSTGGLFHEQTCSRFTRLLGWLFVTMPEVKAKYKFTNTQILPMTKFQKYSTCSCVKYLLQCYGVHGNGEKNHSFNHSTPSTCGGISSSWCREESIMALPRMRMSDSLPNSWLVASPSSEPLLRARDETRSFTSTCSIFLASTDAQQAMWVTESLIVNRLYWWELRIPSRDLTDVTLVSEDAWRS